MTDIAISLLLAAIGSLLTFLAAYVSRRVRDRHLKRRFPVAGRFISEYEDLKGEERVVTKSLTVLRQRGRAIVGETVELEGSRSWELQGVVESGGFIHGVYAAEDPHDNGNGTFYLKIDGGSGDMDGLWAGYDSVNGEIEGGRYTFKRSADVTVRSAKLEEARSVCSLLGDALGELYVDLASVREAISDDAKSACFVAVTRQDHVVAAVTVSLVDQSSIEEFLPEGQDSLVRSLRVLRHNETVALLRSIAVRPRYRGRSIATQLTARAMYWAAEREATAALTFGWRSPQGCHIAGVMETSGFRSEADIPNFWTADSRLHDYSCPVCGDTCECGAVIFVRALE